MLVGREVMLLIELAALCGLLWGWMLAGHRRRQQKHTQLFLLPPMLCRTSSAPARNWPGRSARKGRAVTFAGNLLLFTVVLFVTGLLTGSRISRGNFLNTPDFGAGLNLFDLVVIDLLWWRHTRRVRFSRHGKPAGAVRRPR